MSRLANWWNTTRRTDRALLAVVVMSVPTVLPGCGIPDLCPAHSGAPLPGRFEDANNFQYYQDAPIPAYPPEIGPAQSRKSRESQPPEAETAKTEAPAKASRQGRFVETALLKRITLPIKSGAANGAIDPDSGMPALVSFTEPQSELELASADDSSAGTASRADFAEPAEPVDPSDGGGLEPAPAISQSIPAPDPAMIGPADPQEAGAPQRWTNTTENASYIPMKVFYEDPHLGNLIDQALVGNQELRILTQEIQIANFEVQARRGAYLPFLTFGADAGIDKPGRFTRAGAVEDQLEIRPGKAFPEPLPDFLVAANLSWELDVWRALRNARDAASIRYLATQDGQNYIVTRLVAEIAEKYYELLALDNRLMALEQTIAIQEQSLKVAEAKKEAGTDTELGVQRFQAEVRKNQSERLIIQQEIVEAENRINFLCGRYPQMVERDPQNFLNLHLQALGAGIPSELLRNRADVRQAERQLQAAGLDVLVARANFYPRVAINAGVGYNAFNAKYLFNTPESLIYNVAGDIVAPLINRAAIKAEYLTANAEQLQAVYKYQQTLLNAYTEVINRLAKVENYGQSIEIKKQQLAALEASVNSATQLFQNARAEYVEVLLAQRDLMEARMVLIRTKQEQLSAIVSAYQALGGGGVQLSF